MNSKLFISHSTKDKDLVDRFIVFLQTALEIKVKDIYYTSRRGTLRTGQNFIQSIRDNIRSTDLVILFITPNYLKSDFCMCELGAAWALGDNVYPILIDPIKYNNLSSTPLHTVTQYLALKDEDDLLQLCEEFLDMNLVERFNSIYAKSQSNQFITDMPDLTNFEMERQSISIEEYKKLEVEIEGVIQKDIEKQSEINKLKEKIEKLKKAKTSKEVSEIIIDNDETEAFDKMIDDIKDMCRELDDIVISSIYCNHYYSGEMNFWINDDGFHRAREMEAEGYLVIDFDEGIIDINKDQPKIRKFFDSIENLDWFIEQESSKDFHNYFSEEYEQILSIHNKWIWVKLFGVNISMN